MAVIRVHKTKDYTVMSNTHLKDMDLSLAARGLLSTILSLPPDWNYSIRGLAAICKEGERAVRTALNELKASGYVAVTRVNPTGGNNRVRYEYDIFEVPQKQPSTAKPQVAEHGGCEGVHGEVVQGEHVQTSSQLNTEELTGSQPNLKDYPIVNLPNLKVSSTEEQIFANAKSEPSKGKPRKQKTFVPPTLEEVQAYVSGKGYHFDAQSFIDYYEAGDWHSSNGKPIKSWKRACVTWENMWKDRHPNHREVSRSDYSAYDAAFHAR